MKKLIPILISILALNINAQVCFTSATNYTVGSGPWGLASADFNGDGKADLVTTANTSTNNVFILLGNGLGGFAPSTNFTAGTGTFPFGVISGDFNGDANSDVVTSNSGGNNISILLGNGAGSFGAPNSFPANNNPHAIISADFNGDSKLDVAVTNLSSNDISIFLGDGIGGFGVATNYTVNISPYSMLNGDFNEDGKVDLATANAAGNDISILLGNGLGSFGAVTSIPLVGGTNPYGITTGDFNWDGHLDLVTANSGSNNVSIFFGNGTGSFSAPSNYTIGTSPASLTSADINKDGRLDIVTENNTSNNVAILLGTGTGGFAAPLNFIVGNSPRSAPMILDFNGDGKLDLAAANNSSNNVSVLLSTTDSLSGLIIEPNSSFVTSGKVHLFRKELNHVGRYDTAGVVNINTNGTFSFPALPCNNYLLKAIADTATYPNAIGTYFSNKIYPFQWDSGIVINHNTCGGNLNNSGKNVTILEITPMSGPGLISGNVNAVAGYGQRNQPGYSVQGAPLKGVDVKLGKNPGGSPEYRTTTNSGGNYTFSNVAIGNYKIFVDVPNYPMDSVLAVSVTSTNTIFTNNNYLIDSVKIWVDSLTTNIFNLDNRNNSISIYPNPAHENIIIQSSSALGSVVVYNALGEIVFQTKTTDFQTLIDMSKLPSGIYILQTQGNRKKLIKE